MNNPSARKIVSINSAGRDRGPGLRIVAECTDHLCEELSNWLAGIREPIGEELFQLADGTCDRQLQTRYLDLRRDVERDWTQFIEAFRHGLTEAGRQEGTATGALEVPDFDGLQLVDDAVLSEHIVVREFSAQLAESCDEELYSLDRRTAALLGNEEPIDGGNPLGPQALCQALVDAGAALGLDAENRLLLLRRIERHLHQALPAFYREINERLSERGILPDLKRSYRRQTQTGLAGGQARTAASAVEALQEAAAGPFSEGTNDILGALQRLVALRTGGTAPATPPTTIPTTIPAAMSAGPSAAPSTMTLATAPSTAAATDGLACAASISHAFLASLNEAQQMPLPADGGNQIAAIRSSEAAKQASPLESVTIDIVAMLFDFIFNDEELPDSVKLLVGKLQIPVLKVAMLDQSFFANRQHPARRFLDGITGVALCWGRNADKDDPFQLRLGEVVERILREFETNIDIFNDALAELESFVKASEAVEEETISIAAEAAVRREEEESTAEAACEALRPVLERQQPEVVRSFIATHWLEVLQQKGRAHGVDSPAWKEIVEVAEQLVWSVQAKPSGDERMRLISTLPMLLARINAGLGAAGVGDEERSRFFDALVELHAAALKGPLPASDTPAADFPEERRSGSTRGEGDLLVMRHVEDGVTIEDVTLVGATPMRRSRDREAMDAVHALKRGDWVDFINEEGNVARERLNWVSPQKGILVFSNHRAARAISISPDALARQIRDGAARVVADTSVFDKAIDGVIRSLNAA